MDRAEDTDFNNHVQNYQRGLSGGDYNLALSAGAHTIDQMRKSYFTSSEAYIASQRGQRVLKEARSRVIQMKDGGEIAVTSPPPERRVRRSTSGFTQVDLVPELTKGLMREKTEQAAKELRRADGAPACGVHATFHAA